MHRFLILLLFSGACHAIATCPVTVGTITLSVTPSRVAGVSPFLVFLDATATTDTSINGTTTVFQDGAFLWNFSDTGTSGKGTWAYGAQSAYTSKNVATGGIAAHLYITGGLDTVYSPIVRYTNPSGVTAACAVQVQAYDASGSNGFPNAATTCVAATSTPAAGSGLCPAGAAVAKQPNFATAIASFGGSNKRILFKCGDTFTGNNATLNGIKWSLGAYGSCTGTQTGRPIFSNTSTNDYLVVAGSAGDGRIADIDFEGSGGTTGDAVDSIIPSVGNVPYQISLINLYSNNNQGSYAWSQGAQWGLISSVMTGMGLNAGQGVYVNYNENNPTRWVGATFPNLNYQALLGNSFSGTGVVNDNQGRETVRISACRMCVVENNTIQNANDVGAVLKIHNGNTNNSSVTWTGVWTELFVISDNWLGGTSGANLVETTTQNANDDERLRNFVIERNMFVSGPGAVDGRQLYEGALTTSIRDNVFYVTPGVANPPYAGVQVAQRSIVAGNPVPSAVEAYNNTCYFATAQSGQYCIGFDSGSGSNAPGINSFAKNNLIFATSASYVAVLNNGTGNTVSANTANATSNPGFANRTGSFSVPVDFKPSANYTGGASVPVQSDILGVTWPPTWDLGAVHH